MVNSSDIQLAYIDLYKNIRKYIWDLDSVELIAKIEDEAKHPVKLLQFCGTTKVESIFGVLSPIVILLYALFIVIHELVILGVGIFEFIVLSAKQ